MRLRSKKSIVHIAECLILVLSFGGILLLGVANPVWADRPHGFGEKCKEKYDEDKYEIECEGEGYKYKYKEDKDGYEEEVEGTPPYWLYPHHGYGQKCKEKYDKGKYEFECE